MAALKRPGEGMNVIKVADTFMLGNGSPGPCYSPTSSPHSMKYILIPPFYNDLNATLKDFVGMQY